MEFRSERIDGVDAHYQRLPYNPLMNVEILRSLFPHFAISDCKTLRLVNKTWYQELQQRWMDETVVKIALEPSYHEVTDSVVDIFNQGRTCNYNCISMNDFLNHLDSTSANGRLFGGKPIRNLRTCQECCNDIHDYDVPGSSLEKFWSICGPSLKYLDLNYVLFSVYQDVRKLLFELTPNLEKLKFTSYDCLFYALNEPELIRLEPANFPQCNLKSVSIGLVDQFPLSWISFFSSFPNIQELKLALLHWDLISGDVSTILDVFRTIRASQGNEVLNLTDLALHNYQDEVYWEFGEDSATKLCRLQLPLSNLDLRWLDIDKNVLAQVIQSHRETLKSLTLKRSGRFLFSFPYQVLPENLKKLTLSGKVFPTWRFLKYTPNLQKLDLQMTGTRHPALVLKSCVAFKRGRIPVLTHLTELRYETENPVSANTVKLLIKAMPNVTKLEMSVGNRGFQEICKRWKLRKWVIQKLKVKEDTFVKHIALLSYLSEVTIIQHNFGEMAIHEGFLKLKNLSRLVTNFSPEVSASSIALLKSRIFDVIVT